MGKQKTNRGFGYLQPQFNFSLNPYPDMRFSRCPICESKTGQRKLPLLIHVDPQNLIALNYTNRYCSRCNMLIGHKDEIEHHLTVLFMSNNEEIVGNRYLIFGTVEKKAWRENMVAPKPLESLRHHISNFESFQELRMTMTGWFPKGEKPPVMVPPGSTEWIKP
jgi:hypothetical protein